MTIIIIIFIPLATVSSITATVTPISYSGSFPARQGHTATYFNDAIIVIGGHNGNYMNDVQSYSVISNSWNSISYSGTQ